jgi:hypothetical protein
MLLCFEKKRKGVKRSRRLIRSSRHLPVYVSWSPLQLPNTLTDFHEISYERYASEWQPSDVYCNLDQRTILAPIILSFCTGLYKFFKILLCRWTAQGYIILLADKYEARSYGFQLHKRPAPRDLCNRAFRDPATELWTPCSSIICHSFLE